MYADHDYYSGTYYGVLISPDDWPRYARQAEAYLNSITFGRIPSSGTLPNAVKNAACAVADQFYTEAQESAHSGVKSENIDGYSVTYEDAAAARAAHDAARYDAAALYLLQTGLLDRGVCYHANQC